MSNDRRRNRVADCTPNACRMFLEIHCYHRMMATWSFLTRHARVLLVIDSNPDIRLRDIAAAVGISERRAHDIVSDLADSGYLAKQRTGRRNAYEVQHHRPLRDDLTDHRTIGDILALLSHTSTAEQRRADDRSGAG